MDLCGAEPFLRGSGVQDRAVEGFAGRTGGPVEQFDVRVQAVRARVLGPRRRPGSSRGLRASAASPVPRESGTGVLPGVRDGGRASSGPSCGVLSDPLGANGTIGIPGAWFDTDHGSVLKLRHGESRTPVARSNPHQLWHLRGDADNRSAIDSRLKLPTGPVERPSSEEPSRRWGLGGRDAGTITAVRYAREDLPALHW